MKLEFDPTADAAYLEISGAEIASTRTIQSGINADYDAEGNITGIEVLSVSKRAVPAPVKKVAYSSPP